jgi:hypothetical protein
MRETPLAERFDPQPEAALRAICHAERLTEIADVLAEGGRYLDLDVEMAVAGPVDGAVDALEAGVAVGRAEEHISDRIGITPASLR